MANAAALINEGLWRKDKDFQRLPRLAQCTFCQVLSQKDLDTAGVLTLHMELLAKACAELTVEQLMKDFADLEAARFLFVDYDTDELLVRSYVRLVSGVSPQTNNAWKSVPKNARILASEKLRHELALELRRLRWKVATDLADEIDPVGTPLQPPPNPLGTRSQGATPSEGGSNPPSSVPVPVLVSPSVVGHLGERPTCSKHPNGDTGESCGGCARVSRWDTQHVEAIKAAEAEERERAAQVVKSCPICHGTNWIPDTEPAVKCTHRHLEAVHA